MIDAAPAAIERQETGDPLKGVLLTGLGAFCFSLAPIFARSVVGFPTAAIAFYRALFTALTLAILTAVWPARRAEVNLSRLDRRTWLLLLALGLLMGLTSLFYTHAYLHTTVAKAVLLNYTAPIYVALLGPALLHESRCRYFRVAVPLGFVGIALIAEPAKLASFAPGEIGGILSGAASGLTFAAVFMLGRYLAQGVAPIVRTLAGAITMVVMFVPWGIAAPGDLLLRNLPWLAGLGFFAMALPYLFIFGGQKYVTAQVGSMVALFEPVCGVLIGYLVYAEQLSVLGIVGAAAVLASIYLSSK